MAISIEENSVTGAYIKSDVRDRQCPYFPLLYYTLLRIALKQKFVKVYNKIIACNHIYNCWLAFHCLISGPFCHTNISIAWNKSVIGRVALQLVSSPPTLNLSVWRKLVSFILLQLLNKLTNFKTSTFSEYFY